MNKFPIILLLYCSLFLSSTSYAQLADTNNLANALQNQDCGTPQGMSAILFNSQAIKVTWRGAPATPDGIHYAIRYRKTGDEIWTQKETNAGNQYFIYDIDFTQAYDIEISAICARSNSPNRWLSVSYQEAQNPLALRL